MINLSELAWQKIWETAPSEEVHLILTKTKIPIPGFRLKTINIVPKTILDKLILSPSNRKKIIQCYRTIIDNKETDSFNIIDAKRNKLINSLLYSKAADADEINDIMEHLDEGALENVIGINSSFKIALKPETEDNDNWQKKYKTLERRTNEKIKKYEKRMEEKTKDVNDAKRKVSEIEKSFTKRYALIESENKEILKQHEYYLNQIDKLNKKNTELQNDLDFYKEENIKLTSILKEAQNNYDGLLHKVDSMVAESEEKVKICCETDRDLQEELVKQEYIEKPNVLVLGNVSTKQDKISCHKMKYIDLKEIEMSALCEICAEADKIIILSWSITTAKQRKIREMMTDNKIFQFDDYTAFCEYVKKEELKDIGNI